MKIQRITDRERQYIDEVLNEEFRSSKGSMMTSRLEKAFAEKFDSKYAIAFCNGTATLHIALEAAGVGKGDEVIVPPLTMSSTTLCVLEANATPIFADVDPETFVIDPKSIEKCISPRTKAIIPVSLFGLAPDFDAINAIAKKHNLTVIEDDAQCFLGKYKGKTVGTLGDIASFSFQSSKHMTSGEGGMIITQSEELADKIRKLACLGYASVGAKKGKISKTDIQDPNYSRHISLGWNYRMSEICSAVSLGQLEHLDELVEMRIKSANIFMDAVRGTSLLTFQKTPDYCVNSYWATVAKLREDVSWYAFRDKFLENGGDGLYAAWKLAYKEPFFLEGNFLGRDEFFTEGARYEDGICPVAEALQPRLVQFKTNYFDTDEAEYYAEILRKTVKYFE